MQMQQLLKNLMSTHHTEVNLLPKSSLLKEGAQAWQETDKSNTTEVL